MKNVFILLGTAVAWLLVSVDSHWNYGMYSLMRLFIKPPAKVAVH